MNTEDKPNTAPAMVSFRPTAKQHKAIVALASALTKQQGQVINRTKTLGFAVEKAAEVMGIKL